MKKLKRALKRNGYRYVRWGTAMSAFSMVSGLLYEIGEVPPEWQFKPSCLGNLIDEDDPFYEYFKDAKPEKLLEYGNYLNRLTKLLVKAGENY